MPEVIVNGEKSLNYNMSSRGQSVFIVSSNRTYIKNAFGVSFEKDNMYSFVAGTWKLQDLSFAEAIFN